MLKEVYHYFVVYGLSMFKFILGPITAKIYNMNLFETVLFTVLGMMTSVFLFSSVLGNKIHIWMMNSFFKNRKLFSKKNRRMVKVWREYGLKGVAFLTPILFTPIGGTIIATSFGEHRNKIFKYMFLSAVFWAIIISFAILTFRINNLHLLHHN